MKLKGKIFKFGHDIDTDAIIPAQYLNIFVPQQLAPHAMEGIDPDFVNKIQKGDIIVAGENFGCGSSREHAPLALKHAGISTVIAHSFARIFFRNAVNIDLPILESPEAVKETKEGDQLEIDLEKRTITNLRTKKTYQAKPFPKEIEKIIKAGGLMQYLKTRQKLKHLGGQGRQNG